MNDIHELRGFEAYLNSMAGAGVAGISRIALRAKLDSLRPTLPFDLEPSRINPPTIYTTTQADQMYCLWDRYDAVRKWHELSERVAELVETVK